MDTYALYTYKFCEPKSVQGNLFAPKNVKIDMSTGDKNLWLDRLFGDRGTDVYIQNMLKNGGGSDKFPCKVLAHGTGRVVWLRMENEKLRRIWVKSESISPDEPEIITPKYISENPYSHVFLDFREDRNLIAIMKENDAWRNTDITARLLEGSLNMIMAGVGYGFAIKLLPVTVSKDFWDYNRKLIIKDKIKVKKMTIYFGSGSLDPKIEELINQTPILKRLLKEMWNAKRGKLELEDPLGSSIMDGRKRDFKNIIELVGSNLTSDDFGVSLSYAGGKEVVCGKDVRLMFPMQPITYSTLLDKDLFGGYRINDWLDHAQSYIKKEKDGTTVGTKPNKKNPRHVQGTSDSLDDL